MVRELYSTEVAAGYSILATPISRGGVSDKLIWRHVKHDRYEVKIGFQVPTAAGIGSKGNSGNGFSLEGHSS